MKTILLLIAGAATLHAAEALPAAKPHELLVPAEKKLPADWVASLTARGEPQWVSGDGLKWIGMPVGGIAAGQLYLGGDGKLWHWGYFQRVYRYRRGRAALSTR